MSEVSIWPMRRVGDIFSIKAGITLGPHRQAKAAGSGYLRVANVQRGRIDKSDIALLNASLAERRHYRLSAGDLLVVEGHANPGEIGRCALVQQADEGLLYQNHLFRLRSNEVWPNFAAAWLNSEAARDYWRTVCATSSGLYTVNSRQLVAMPFPDVPVGEQRRIAEILDTLDAQLSNSQALIEKFSVIDRGLLQYTLWEGMRVASAGGAWRWGLVGNVGEVKLGRQRSPQHESGRHMRPYLRVANVFDSYINYSDVLEMNFTPREQDTYSLRRGDILLNEGQSLELVGRSAIFDGPSGICFQNTLVRFRAGLVSPEYAQAVFRYWLMTGEFVKIAKQTTSIAHLGADRFARMSFPIPPKDEETRVVRSLRLLSERMRVERERVKSLNLLKNGLMEDLLTGRVRVSEAEAVLEGL
ncbi:restriction endonuclease subunit S [Sphaerisporangium sp. NPDC049002]|uniref:restriction endonuclease subunit S n=1 Tax=Sphaerisporangium sp. NPDC049002 TaxID=3155392 RepID=UPI0033D2499F